MLQGVDVKWLTATVAICVCEVLEVTAVCVPPEVHCGPTSEPATAVRASVIAEVIHSMQATAGGVAGGRPSYHSNCGRVARSV